MDYAFEAKQKGYREPAWMFADRMCKRPRALRRVAILDTAQGLEVRHLLSLGYRAENILTVNYSAAHLAALTLGLKRDGLPPTTTRAGEFGDVLSKWDSPLDIISFDTTSNLRARSFMGLRRAVGRHQPSVVMVVVLGGRETGHLASSIADVAATIAPKRDSLGKPRPASHYIRARMVFDLLSAPYAIPHFRWSCYVSASGQPMVWAVSGPPNGEYRKGDPRARGSLLDALADLKAADARVAAFEAEMDKLVKAR